MDRALNGQKTALSGPKTALSDPKIDSATAATVFLAALGLYLWTLPTRITFEDAGLFHSVCATSGIAHPPGYPLFTLLCSPLYALPLDPLLIGNTMSAVFGALACAVLVLILRRLDCNRLIAATGGLLLSVSDAFWSQAIIVEVYTLNTLIFAVVLYLCIRFGQAPSERRAWLICFWFGLGLSNHWPLMVLAFPGLLIICLSSWRWLQSHPRKIRLVAVAAVCLVAGLTPYLALLINDGSGISYGGPIPDLPALLSYVMRESYASLDQQVGVNLGDQLQYLAWLGGQWMTQVTWLGLPLAGIALAKPRATFTPWIRAGLLLVFLFNTAVLVFLLGFDFDYIFQAVFRVYPMLAYTCFIIFVALGLRALDELASVKLRHGEFAGYPVCALLLALTLAGNFEANNRSHAWVAADYADLILESVEKDAVLVASSDSQLLPLLHRKVIDGARPDVTLYQINDVIAPQKIPGTSQSQHLAYLHQLASTTPVYSIGVNTMPMERDFGLYIRHDGTGQTSVGRNENHDEFRRRLLNAYTSGVISDPHELFFTGQLLLGISHQLLMLASETELTQAEVNDLVALQETFPGTTATLYTALTNRNFRLPGDQLLAMAFAMEANFPPETSNQNRATFYYYVALLFLQARHGIATDVNLALEFLEKSFLALPTPDNPGICMLRQLLRQQGTGSNHPVMAATFEEKCRQG